MKIFDDRHSGRSFQDNPKEGRAFLPSFDAIDNFLEHDVFNTLRLFYSFP